MTNARPLSLLRHRAAPLVILLLALVSFGIGLAELPVQDRDEARFAQAARQMAESGDLIDIRFLDQPRHKKPAFIYWMQTAAIWITGYTPSETPIWVHRLPSYIAGVFSALALIWAATPLVGRRAAVIAGVMCATVYMLHAEARTAKTDAALLLSVILAMGAMGRVWLGQSTRWITPAIFWTAMAAGFLLKGPLVALPVAGAALWCGVKARSLRWLGGLRPLPGILWFALLSAPWYIAITIVTDGAFWAGSVGTDFADKITAGGEHGGRPPGLYLVTMWFTFWPWSVLIPLGLAYAWATRTSAETAFLLGWLIPGWLVFEAVPVKLIHYTLPLYPALMILCAAALLGVAEGARRFRGALGVVGTLGFALGAAGFAYVMVEGPAAYGPGRDPASLIAAAAMVAVALLALVFLWRHRVGPALAALAVAGAIMGGTLTASTLPNARTFWISEEILAATRLHTCLEEPIAVVGYTEPSLAFLFGGNIRIHGEEAGLDYLAGGENRAAWMPTELAGEDVGTMGVTRIIGINFTNFQPVDQRLFVSPGVPAPDDPCAG